MLQVTDVRKADLVPLLKVELHTGESVPVFCRRGEKCKAARELPWREIVLRQRAAEARMRRKLSAAKVH